MLRYLFQQPPDLVGFLSLALVFVIALALHEYGHAASANLQGDPTARLAGRLTLNPKAHIDPFGALMLVLVGFGWGRPVPFSPNKLRYRRWGAALVAIAGPLVNLLLAVACASLRITLLRAGIIDFQGVTDRFLEIGVYLNLVLALFNLIPVPPLDGSRILGALLPPERQHIVYFLDRWGFVILLLVVFFLFPSFAGPVVRAAENLVYVLVGGA